jgi:hydrogenase maturation protein HypF
MDKARRRIAIQGVGFRPFVYGLALDLGLTGWVNNSPQGVTIEVEADSDRLDRFTQRLIAQLPPNASIDHIESQVIPPLDELTFEIRSSEQHGAKTALILPDLATCPDCLRDIRDPTNRRYRYPFTNCTHCGPRFSIIQALPYDRTNTTMRGFSMCDECRAEYENPLDRRFHAQPNACPRCGPQLALWDQQGRTLYRRDDAMLAAAQALREGQIVALKGLGGFQLCVDARNDDAVRRLRQRKGRYEKPFAVMYPSLHQAEKDCAINDAEARWLTSPAAPIVLLPYLGTQIASAVAPDNPYLGVILPYTPLHHLLLAELGFPIVATSGNRSGDPIVTDNGQALAVLGDIADVLLVHDRPIARHVDDSVLFVFEDQPVMLRRARGYAPASVHLPAATSAITSVGAQQKNTLAVAHHGSAFLSQHLGDMQNAAVVEAFERIFDDLHQIYDLHPVAVACDLHPDYTSTRLAEQIDLPIIRVQHHYAHVLSCMAEHHLAPPVLGIAWDGTGYGTDGTIWGSEFLRVDADGFERIGHLAAFPLPGGEAAALEPRRSALGVLYALYGDDLPRDRLEFTPRELDLLLAALHKGINAPLSSSMGRMFDAVAALIGLRQRCSFEGQAAMLLEFAAHGANSDECYPFHITPVTRGDRPVKYIIEWKAMIEALLQDANPAVMAVRFHNTLAAMIVSIAQHVGEPQVVLSGGCFQNRLLLHKAVNALRKAGFTPIWQQQIPPNDGGIALGQVLAALREINYVSGSTGKNPQHQR